VRALAFAAVWAVSGVVWLAAVQAPETAFKDFEASMVEIGDAFDVAEQMTPSPAFLLNSVRGDLLARVEAASRRMEHVRMFFAGRKKRDGVELADQAAAALAGFREELTRATPDQTSAVEALDVVARACTACHEVYREGNETVGFRFKASAL
jgi:hypothetical protein